MSIAIRLQGQWRRPSGFPSFEIVMYEAPAIMSVTDTETMTETLIPVRDIRARFDHHPDPHRPWLMDPQGVRWLLDGSGDVA